MKKDLQIPSHYSDKRLAHDGGKFIYDGELSSILNVSRCFMLTYENVCMLVIMDIPLDGSTQKYSYQCELR